MTQALHMRYRVEKWRRCLALTQAAIVGVQSDARVGFSQLVQERRTAAGLTRLCSRGLLGSTTKRSATSSAAVSSSAAKRSLHCSPSRRAGIDLGRRWAGNC